MAVSWGRRHTFRKKSGLRARVRTPRPGQEMVRMDEPRDQGCEMGAPLWSEKRLEEGTFELDLKVVGVLQG